MNSKLSIAVLAALVSLAGCGGGSSNTATAPTGGAQLDAPITTPSPSAPVTGPAPATTPVATNALPVANAGPIQSILQGGSVTLDGSASSDADNDPLTYLWAMSSKPAASVAVLSSTSTPKPSFVADVAGDYLLTLLVNDGKASSTASTIKVTASVANAAPVANAGPAANAMTASRVMLDGSASSDANGDVLTYAWVLTRPTGSAAVLSDATAVKPSFVPDVAGTYIATLTVNDGKINSQPIPVTITVALSNSPPMANAGLASRVVIGSTASFNGAGSTDANGDAMSYSWNLTSKPPGSQAALSASNTVAPSITADVAGTYVASLVVSDGKSLSPIATTTVTAVPRLAAALGISFGDSYGDFCNMSGTFTNFGTTGSGTWTINNCQVFGSAGAPLRARIQNNGTTPINLTSIAIFSVYFGNGYSISPASQAILPGAIAEFNLPLWMALEVTNATATFKIDGEPDLVVRLKGSMNLP